MKKTTLTEKVIFVLVIIFSLTIWGSFFSICNNLYFLLGAYLGVVNFKFTDYYTKKNIKKYWVAHLVRMLNIFLIFISVGLLNFKSQTIIISLISTLMGYSILKGYYIIMKTRGKDLC